MSDAITQAHAIESMLRALNTNGAEVQADRLSLLGPDGTHLGDLVRDAGGAWRLEAPLPELTVGRGVRREFAGYTSFYRVVELDDDNPGRFRAVDVQSDRWLWMHVDGLGVEFVPESEMPPYTAPSGIEADAPPEVVDEFHIKPPHTGVGTVASFEWDKIGWRITSWGRWSAGLSNDGAAFIARAMQRQAGGR